MNRLTALLEVEGVWEIRTKAGEIIGHAVPLAAAIVMAHGEYRDRGEHVIILPYIPSE